MLPQNVAEFAGWIGRTRKREVYVVTTYTRPVPLEHHLWSGLNGAMHKVCDTQRRWIKEGFKAAGISKKEEHEMKKAGGSGGRGGGQKVFFVALQTANIHVSREIGP